MISTTMTKVEIDVPEEIVPYFDETDEDILTREDVERCIERLKEREIRISEKLYQKLREHMD